MTPTVIGIVFIVIAQGVFQAKETRRYDSLNDCWSDAQILLNDKKSPYHMACVPQFIAGTST